MIRYKSATFLYFWAELFDRSFSPTYKKYLPLPNQLHFQTEHVQSIVKVKNKVYCPGGNGKVGWWSLFSNSVSLMVRLNGLFWFFINTYTQYNDLIFGLHMPEALISLF